MKRKELKELSIVELQWLDSCHLPGWQYRRSGYEFDPSEQHSIGFVVANSKKGIVISTSYGVDGEDNESKYGGVHTPLNIPWCSITKLKVLREGKKAR